MNNVTLTGRIVADAQVKAHNGKPSATILARIAVKKSKDETTFINFTMYAQDANVVQALGNKLQKGNLVEMQGTLDTYENALQLAINKVSVLARAEANKQAQQAQYTTQPPMQQPQYAPQPQYVQQPMQQVPFVHNAPY